MQAAKIGSSALLPARRAAFQRSPAVIKARLPSVVVRAAQEPQESKAIHEKLALPAAALLGAALLFAATPDEALAARSGGRVGGSGGFAARRSAPPPPSRAPAVVNNYYSPPPVFGGWGFGFGIPVFPGFGFGVPMFGGFSFLFNIMLLGIILQVVWSVVQNFTNSSGSSGSGKRNDKDEEW